MIVVEPGKLSQEIERLRREEGKENIKDKNSLPKVRATLSNFIFLTTEKEEHSVDTLLSSIATTYPSRFFLIICTEKENVLETKIVKRLIPDSLNNLTEEVHITISGNKLKVLKNLILSNLLPDIETICVSTDEKMSENELLCFKEIIQISDSIILKYPEEISTEALKEEKSKRDVSVKYILEKKIIPWKDAISQQFESSYCLEALSKLTNLEIAYSGGEEGKIDANILLQWIVKKIPESISYKKNLVELKNDTFVGIKNVNFLMGVSTKDHKGYEVKCTLLPEISTIEVCASGDGYNENSCDFSIRRIPHRVKNLEQLLMDTI